jgi:hypothetical protein
LLAGFVFVFDSITTPSGYPPYDPHWGKTNAICAPFYSKNGHFSKTGSGQTQGKLTKECRFLAEFAGLPDADTGKKTDVFFPPFYA